METRLAAAMGLADRPAVPPKRAVFSSRWYVSAAAVALIVLVAGRLWLRPVAFTAPTGEIVTVDLPDGSSVELNSGSRLTYRRPFHWRSRRVRLHGEAFFDVAHGSTPFVAETFNSTVTVLGTRFNVRAWPDASTAATAVVLEQGQVRLAAGPDAKEAVVLEPGQMSRVTGRSDPTSPVPASVEDALAWRSGGLRFDDAPLGDILDELERRTGTSITVAEPALRDLRATLIVDRVQSVEAVLALLAEMRNLRYSRTGNAYVLAPSPQP